MSPGAPPEFRIGGPDGPLVPAAVVDRAAEIVLGALETENIEKNGENGRKRAKTVKTVKNGGTCAVDG